MAISRLSNSTVLNGIPKFQNQWDGSTGVVQNLSPTFWLDAQDSSTVVLSGANVTSWNDKSGNSRNFTQGTAGRYPGYSSSEINGYPALTFNGASPGSTGAGLDFGSSNFPLFSTNSSAVTFFFVYKANDLSWQQFFFTWNVTGSCQNFECGMYDMGGSRGPAYAFGVHKGCSQGVRGTWIATGSGTSYIHVIQVKASGSAPSNYLQRINKTTITSSNSYAGAWFSAGSYPTGNGTCRIGARKDSDTSGFESTFSGSIGEIILYKSELSLENIQLVENYLANKWGI